MPYYTFQSQQPDFSDFRSPLPFTLRQVRNAAIPLAGTSTVFTTCVLHLAYHCLCSLSPWRWTSLRSIAGSWRALTWSSLPRFRTFIGPATASVLSRLYAPMVSDVAIRRDHNTRLVKPGFPTSSELLSLPSSPPADSRRKRRAVTR